MNIRSALVLTFIFLPSLTILTSHSITPETPDINYCDEKNFDQILQNLKKRRQSIPPSSIKEFDTEAISFANDILAGCGCSNSASTVYKNQQQRIVETYIRNFNIAKAPSCNLSVALETSLLVAKNHNNPTMATVLLNHMQKQNCLTNATLDRFKAQFSDSPDIISILNRYYQR